MIRLGFIGFGEAAYHISAGLLGEGLSGIVAFDAMASREPMCALIRRRAEEARVTLLEHPQEVVHQSDIVIVSVPSSYTMDACRSVVDALRPGQIYVDVGASTPQIKKQEWELVQKTGALFSDSAMLGSLPQSRHKVPIVASGNGAQRFCDALAPYQMKIELAGENPGDASAIKLVRSIFMKGLAALMLEMLDGAQAHGVSERVISSIGASLDGIAFQQHLDRLITGTAIHAHRRAAELDGSIQMLTEAGLCSVMTAATQKRHTMLERYRFPERFTARSPKDWQEIYSVIHREESEQLTH